MSVTSWGATRRPSKPAGVPALRRPRWQGFGLRGRPCLCTWFPGTLGHANELPMDARRCRAAPARHRLRVPKPHRRPWHVRQRIRARDERTEGGGGCAQREQRGACTATGSRAAQARGHGRTAREADRRTHGTPAARATTLVCRRSEGDEDDRDPELNRPQKRRARPVSGSRPYLRTTRNFLTTARPFTSSR